MQWLLFSFIGDVRWEMLAHYGFMMSLSYLVQLCCNVLRKRCYLDVIQDLGERLNALI